MNKKEVIEKIKNLNARETFMSEIIWVKRDDVLDIINQLDEPEKPVVPKYVADWYEDNKGDLEFNIYNLCIEYSDNGQGMNKDLKEWFGNDSRTKPIETLMKMKFFEYEVEKEKLYTVELQNPNSDNHLVLRKNFDGKVCVSLLHSEYWRGNESTRLTESEIKQDFDWAWQFAEEVKDND